MRRKKVFKTVEQGVQGGDRCPLLGNVQGQVEWVSGQPDVAEDVPALAVGGPRSPLKVLCNPNYL